MRTPFAVRFYFCWSLCFCLAVCSYADLPVPSQVLEPQTEEEAWNVLRLASANVERLLKEQRLDEVPQQISLCSPSLRLLARLSSSLEQREVLETQGTMAFRRVNDVAQAASAHLQQSCEESFSRFQADLAALKRVFPGHVTEAEIYTCPQHPEMVTASTVANCRFCGGRLRLRRIPCTDLYASSDTRWVKLELTSGPLSPGVESTVSAQLRQPSGALLDMGSLLPLHGATVRLLAVNQAFSDFQVLTPTLMPGGSWSAPMTALTAGPYRFWAEVVPEQTAMPEYPWADLGGVVKPVDASRQAFVESLSTEVEGFKFTLSFASGNGGSPRARQVSLMRLQVTDKSNSPISRLEPLMNAFAHFTAIDDDAQTLLRIHPVGGDILRSDLRGGPALTFKFYPPKAGFLHLFGQVRIDNRDITFPLGIQVVP